MTEELENTIDTACVIVRKHMIQLRQEAVRLEKALEQQGTVLVRAESIRRALSTSVGQVAGAGEVHAELRKIITKNRRR